ncbi:hypothetical protein Scinn_15120 [Streptomyces virginiae]|uniref:Uncharacterized protein n=1 Tax=Streptomyces virginiae TaxID=1961 RepID=A0ABQ3NH54_STRVG|nr:hypothetical protein [Streptomyces virginiae]GHI12049.1 hypothetical protein Scinn_15120 [Streptomyces virginiae]
MTTNTTPQTPTDTVKTAPAPAALLYAIVGGSLLTIVSAFLAWTWTADFPGDLTFYGSPADLQYITLAGAALTLVHALAALGVKGFSWLTPAGSRKPIWFPGPRQHGRHLGSRSSRSPSSSAASSTSNPAPTSPSSLPRPALAAYKLPTTAARVTPAKSKLPKLGRDPRQSPASSPSPLRHHLRHRHR